MLAFSLSPISISLHASLFSLIHVLLFLFFSLSVFFATSLFLLYFSMLPSFLRAYLCAFLFSPHLLFCTALILFSHTLFLFLPLSFISFYAPLSFSHIPLFSYRFSYIFPNTPLKFPSFPRSDDSQGPGQGCLSVEGALLTHPRRYWVRERQCEDLKAVICEADP